MEIIRNRISLASLGDKILFKATVMRMYITIARIIQYIYNDRTIFLNLFPVENYYVECMAFRLVFLGELDVHLFFVCRFT